MTIIINCSFSHVVYAHSFRIYNHHFENSEGMGRVWFSVHSQTTPLQIERHATPKNIMKMAASRAGTLLRYFKTLWNGELFYELFMGTSQTILLLVPNITNNHANTCTNKARNCVYETLSTL